MKIRFVDGNSSRWREEEMAVCPQIDDVVLLNTAALAQGGTKPLIAGRVDHLQFEGNEQGELWITVVVK